MDVTCSLRGDLRAVLRAPEAPKRLPIIPSENKSCHFPLQAVHMSVFFKRISLSKHDC